MKPRQTSHQIKWPYLPTFHLPHPKIGSSEIREVSGPSSAWRRIARLSVPCPESTWCHEGVVVSEGIPQGFPVATWMTWQISGSGLPACHSTIECGEAWRMTSRGGQKNTRRLPSEQWGKYVHYVLNHGCKVLNSASSEHCSKSLYHSIILVGL